MSLAVQAGHSSEWCGYAAVWHTSLLTSSAGGVSGEMPATIPQHTGHCTGGAVGISDAMPVFEPIHVWHKALGRSMQASHAQEEQPLGYCMWLLMQHGTFHVPCWPASCKRSFFTARLWHAGACSCLGNLAHFIVPMLACIVQAQLLHSKAVACCRMRLLRQLDTCHSAYAGLHRASAASSQQGCGILSHAVA